MDLFKLIPDYVYKYLGMAFVALAIFGWRFNLFKLVKVKITLPEDFMRQFRWITPLFLFINLVMTAFILRLLVDLANR